MSLHVMEPPSKDVLEKARGEFGLNEQRIRDAVEQVGCFLPAFRTSLSITQIMVLKIRMKSYLCFVLDSRHAMKVICPYQLAVAVKVCFIKSWNSNTCGCQAIQIFTYVYNHQQTDIHKSYLVCSL